MAGGGRYINERQGCAAAQADAGINAFREALEFCCEGLKCVEAGNFCSGVRQMREAHCLCRRALEEIRCGLCRGDALSGQARRGINRCREGLRDICRGCDDILCGDIRDGIDDCKAGLLSCRQGIEMIENAVEEGPGCGSGR